MEWPKKGSRGKIGELLGSGLVGSHEDVPILLLKTSPVAPLSAIGKVN